MGIHSDNSNKGNPAHDHQDPADDRKPAPAVGGARRAERSLVIARSLFAFDLGGVDDRHDPKRQAAKQRHQNRLHQISRHARCVVFEALLAGRRVGRNCARPCDRKRGQSVAESSIKLPQFWQYNWLGPRLAFDLVIAIGCRAVEFHFDQRGVAKLGESLLRSRGECKQRAISECWPGASHHRTNQGWLDNDSSAASNPDAKAAQHHRRATLEATSAPS